MRAGFSAWLLCRRAWLTMWFSTGTQEIVRFGSSCEPCRSTGASRSRSFSQGPRDCSAAADSQASRSQPPMRDLGLHKVAKGVRTVIVHLQWLFLAALCRLRVPGIGLHPLDCVRSRLAAKPHPALAQSDGNEATSFVHIVVAVHMPDAALGHLGFKGRRRGVDDHLRVAIRTDEFSQIVGILSVGLLPHLHG